MLPSVCPGVCRTLAACASPRFHRIAGADTLVDLDCSWRCHADPGGLHVEHFEQRVIVLVEQDGRSGGGAQLHRASHVIDVGVGDDDLLDLQVVLAEEREDVLNVVAGVDDHGFASRFVADDRAVALQRPTGKDFVDHASIVNSTQ
jgi:hypothetical protein